MASKEQVEAIRDRAIRIADVDPEQIVRADVLGADLSFAPAMLSVEGIRRLMQEVLDAPLADVPPITAGAMINALDELEGALANARSFTVRQGEGARNQMITAIDHAWQQFASVGAHALILKSLDPSAAMREQAETAARSLLDTQKVVAAAVDTANKAAAAAQQAARDAGVVRQALHFAEDAAAHAKAANNWLVASVVVAGLIIAVAVAAFFDWPSVGDETKIGPLLVQHVVARVVILSVLSVAMGFAVRNYGTSRHNFIVNRHRENALKTFKAFLEGAETKAVRDAVLAQAVKAVFSPHASGYLKREPESAAGTPVIELLRAVAPGAKR